MRELSGSTIIRVKRPRPALTGDTRLRLSQIVDLAAFVKDYRDRTPTGTVRRWSDGKLHEKTKHE